MVTFDVHGQAFAQHPRGVSTPALLVTLSIAVLLAIAAIDLAQLSHQRHQLQIGADAAALAATPQLHDRRWLYLGPEGASPPDLEQQLVAVQLTQVYAAQQQAIFYASRNQVADLPIVVEANPQNAGDGDVVVGFVAEPAFETLSGMPGPDGGFNSLLVRASRRKAAGDLPLLWMARQVGLENLDMNVYAQAVIDQRAFGFRPVVLRGPAGEPTNVTQVPVPMLPFAVIPNIDDLTMFPSTAPIHLWWAKGPHDNYAVDPLTQAVTLGSDGIAEMVIRIDSDSNDTPDNDVKTRRGALLGFASGSTSPSAIVHFSKFGLTFADLPGGEINIEDTNNPPIFPCEYNVDSDDLGNICNQLLTASPPLVGSPRILPIGAPINGSSVGIAGFVAGTVVQCMQDSGDGSLLIVIQPCLMQSPTALVGGDSPRNPWIGKLLLNR